MKIKLSFLLITILVLVSCAPTTKIQKTWSDPSLSKEKFDSYKKVLVIAVLKDETGRRIAEDKLVAAFNTITTVQSYTYLTPADTTQQIIEQKLKNDGFDGVLYMRLKEVEKSVTYNQGTGFHGGYGWYGGYHAPGYYSVDKTFVVETNLYDVAVNKLMWSTTTETINPKAIEKGIDGIINTLKNELSKKGYIKL
ncbi:MAG: hypothetical protein KBG80_11480 [Breznakibacter sp.]|nr:hypothetical protein [Breznakibacter sp.]